MNTIIDWFKSLFENIQERIKNPFTESNKTPFAGAFIIALIICNWELVYSLFQFDSDETREHKIAIIHSYLDKQSWEHRILCSVKIAFGSIIFYYVFNNASLIITILFRDCLNFCFEKFVY